MAFCWEQAARHRNGRRLLAVVSVLASVGSCQLLGSRQQGAQDIAVNLAAGRVVLCVAREGIVIGAVEQRVEPGTLPPAVVPLGGRRLAILLGAVEWTSPSSGQPPVHLDRELAHVAGEAFRPQPDSDPRAASDIESLGVAFLERVRVVAGQLHGKLSLQPHEPLVELMLVNYEEGYGPEVWLLKYRVAQDVLRGDYWRTRTLRPSYTQLYPPEKGQPHTLVEVRYPADEPKPALQELLNANDPRLARLGGADQTVARATEHLIRGESQKTPVAHAAALLRAALPVVAAPDAQLILGVLYEQRGLEWIVAPRELPAEKKPRELGAPTLRKKPPL